MNETIYMNRELSWLKFNERVLADFGFTPSLFIYPDVVL